MPTRAVPTSTATPTRSFSTLRPAGINPQATVSGPSVASRNRPESGLTPFVGAPGQDVGGFTGLSPTLMPEFRQRSSEGSRFGTLARQRSLLGQLGSLLPENFVLRASDIPLFEANLNFQQALQGIQDREQGIGRLEQAKASIGISPESTLARELAVQRARGDRPLGQDAIEGARSGIKQQGALALQDASRTLSEQLAARGIGGGVPAVQQAALQQTLAADIAGRLGEFDLKAASLMEEAQRAALADLNALAMEEELRRVALDQLIAEQFLTTQRQPIDLSGLLGKVPDGDLPVGGGGLVL